MVRKKVNIFLREIRIGPMPQPALTVCKGRLSKKEKKCRRQRPASAFFLHPKTKRVLPPLGRYSCFPPTPIHFSPAKSPKSRIMEDDDLSAAAFRKILKICLSRF